MRWSSATRTEPSGNTDGLYVVANASREAGRQAL